MDDAESLAAANKRVGNILRKVEGDMPNLVRVDLLIESAEKQLYEQLQNISSAVTPQLDAGEYAEALKQLAGLRDPVDEFFDRVMVMADDEALKHNRIALLSQLHGLFIKAADLSRLHS